MHIAPLTPVSVARVLLEFPMGIIIELYLCCQDNPPHFIAREGVRLHDQEATGEDVSIPASVTSILECYRITKSKYDVFAEALMFYEGVMDNLNFDHTTQRPGLMPSCAICVCCCHNQLSAFDLPNTLKCNSRSKKAVLTTRANYT